jgi:hypothetical protein
MRLISACNQIKGAIVDVRRGVVAAHGTASRLDDPMSRVWLGIAAMVLVACISFAFWYVYALTDVLSAAPR